MMHPERQQEQSNAQADAEQQRAMHDAGRFEPQSLAPYIRLADAVRAWHKRIDYDAKHQVYTNWANEKRATVRRNLGGAVRAAMKEIDDAK